MALYNSWRSNNHDIAIWKIEESELFFQKATGLSSTIVHPKRRLEFFAGRYLLQMLHPGFPIHEIEVTEHGKPLVAHYPYRFSLSHSFPYVCALLTEKDRAGIDIQVWHRRMTLLQHKFLSAEEQGLFKNDEKLLTVAWNAKESLYKWNGKRGVDFIKHLRLLKHNFHLSHIEASVDWQGNQFHLTTNYLIDKDFSMAYIQ